MLIERTYDLSEMNESVQRDWPGTLAAKHSDELSRLIGHLLQEVDRRSLLLQNVWHAQEWWKSSDYGRDQVQAEIDKYEEKFNGSS